MVDGNAEPAARAARFPEPFARVGDPMAGDDGEGWPPLLAKHGGESQRIADMAQGATGDSPQGPSGGELVQDAGMILGTARVDPGGVGGLGEGVEPRCGVAACLATGARVAQIFICELIDRPWGETGAHRRLGGRSDARSQQDQGVWR